VPSAGLFPTIGNAPIGDAGTPVAVTRGNNQTTMTPDFSLGFGYRVNDWFRIDADYQFSKGPGFGLSQSVYCPEVANAVSNYNVQTVNGVSTIVAVPVGYQYDYTKCDGKLSVNQYNNTGLIMGYIDLGHWGLFTPYIGAGAGVNANSMTGSLTYNQQDTGATYAGATVVGSAPGNWLNQYNGAMQNGYPLYTSLLKPAPTSGTPQPIGPANWNRTINTTKYTFAGELAAGVGIKISQSATLDLAYKIMALDLSAGMKSTMQSLNVGVRYDLN
jgi:opacity protein-like surface antigen